MSDAGIAIVGLAGIFPRAPDVESFWDNIVHGVDAIRDVPPGRWDPVFYDPTSNAPDRFYCRRGGFIDELAEFDAAEFGVMPREAKGAEPDQLLVLKTASRALADAGYVDRAIPNESTGIIVGRGNYIGAGMTRLEQHVRTPEQLLVCLRQLLPGLDEGELDGIKTRFRSALGLYGPETAIGLVPSLTASRVANRLDLYGPAYTVDAACASALVAVSQACDSLENGSCDLMLAGGVHLSHDVAFWSVFSQLGALSRAQQIRPFDRRADGLLIGEGVGLVVLKRLADARRDGDRVHAILRGWGVASDGRHASLMNPYGEGQLMALNRAWRKAGLEPRTVGLVEAHGTGTPIGDATEVETLHRFFGPSANGSPGIGLGSVKSMIGHTMPAAGAAGLIKAVLAVSEGVLPPTLHCEEPLPRLSESRFRLLATAESWKSGATPRRAAVNAFGFGGINAHVVVEADAGTRKAPRGRAGKAASQPHVLALAAASASRLEELLQSGHDRGETGPCRVAVVDPTPERLARARAIVARGRPWRGREGIWFTPQGLLTGGGRWVVLFPGIDSAFRPRFEGIRETAYVPSERLETLGTAVFEFNRALNDAFTSLGVRPDAYAGHSMGEWNGLLASGMLPEDAADAFLSTLEPGSLEVPDVVYLAAGCGALEARSILDGSGAVVVSHDNCPHQTVLSGDAHSIETAARRLKQRSVLCQRLPFRSGFHSPMLRPFLHRFESHVARLSFRPAHTPLWSATTCGVYPADADGLRALLIDHLVQPVRFRELIERFYEEGFRVFVQAGSGRLPGFVDDTLRGRPALALSANVPKREGRQQLAHVAAALFVEGLDPNLDAFQSPPKAAAGARLTLSLGVPLVQPNLDPLPTALAPMTSDRAPSGSVLAQFDELLAEIASASSDVRVRRAKPADGERGLPREHVESVITTVSVERFPALLDHCFFRQAPECEVLEQRYPVVPMTMSVDMMARAAERTAGGKVAVALEGVRSLKWLAAAEPVELQIRTSWRQRELVEVRLGNYGGGWVRLADSWPTAPQPRDRRLEGERAAPITTERLYRDGWMFHGPSYQGIRELGPVGANGIRGTIVAGDASGAVLDNAGQLLGYWVMLHSAANRLAMPMEIDRLELFGPTPAAGTPVDCVVWIRSLEHDAVSADMELTVRGEVWARVHGWKDRRFETDDRVWPVIRQPDFHLLADIHDGGFALFQDTYRAQHSRDYLSRRYLSSRERQVYLGVGPHRQRQWLSGRIAAKDAARAWLWEHGRGPIFPAEIAVLDDAAGRPVLSGSLQGDLRVSLAHQDQWAVALVRESSAPGIDIERITPRGESFAETAFSPSEAALLPERGRDAWIAKFLSAKEAAAKATGRRASELSIEEVGEKRIVAGGLPIHTVRQGDYVVSWTP